MAKKVKINVIELLLKNNKVAKFGEIVDESQLSSSADELKKKGYITGLSKSDLKDLDSNKKDDEDQGSETPYSDLTKAELSDELSSRKIEHDPKAKNDDLIRLLLEDDDKNEK